MRVAMSNPKKLLNQLEKKREREREREGGRERGRDIYIYICIYRERERERESFLQNILILLVYAHLSEIVRRIKV